MSSDGVRKPVRFLSAGAASLAFVLVVPIAVAGVNTWTTAGPESTLVQALATDLTGLSSLYAGAFGALFRQKNERWEKTLEESLYPFLYAVAIDPRDGRTIYLGVSADWGFSLPSGGIYKSSDGGRTWVFIDVFQGYPVLSIVIDPSESKTIFVVASQCTCLPPGCIHAISCSGRVFKSLDGGLSWARQGDIQGVSAIVIDPKTPSTIYALAAGGSFRSQDGGSTWSAMNDGLSQCGGAAFRLAISASDPKTLFVAMSSLCPVALYKTTDGGMTWQPTALRSSEFGFAMEVVIDPTNADIVYLAAIPYGQRSGGLFRSTDGGQIWSRLDEGLPSSDIYLVAVDQDGGGVHVSISRKGVYDYRFFAAPVARNSPPLRSRPPITVPNH
jgi:photosystem II stability/assembly factor-like uncharacterized protein